MINTLLRAKHWQVFSIVYGLPFLIYIFVVYQVLSGFQHFEGETGSGFAAGVITSSLKYLIVFGFIAAIVYWLWYWSIGVGLHSKVPEDVELPNTTFKVFLFIPAVYILVVMLFMLVMMNQLFSTSPVVEPPFNPGLFAFILPVHFFSIFCVFYCIYFVAKTIKTVELQREVKFSDFVAEFFLVWFFPIGIWILQPTINRLVEDDDDNNISEIL